MPPDVGIGLATLVVILVAAFFGFLTTAGCYWGKQATRFQFFLCWWLSSLVIGFVLYAVILKML